MKISHMEKKRWLEFFLLACFFSVMSVQYLPRLFHEAAGLLFGAAAALHIYWNRRWFGSLSYGAWAPARLLLTVVSLLLVLAFFVVLLTGLPISNELFSAVLPLSWRRETHPCSGCDRCHMDGDCIYDDAIEKKLMPKMLEADMLVLVTPLYYFGMSAQLKTIVDRFYSRTGRLHGKRSALIATAYNSVESFCTHEGSGLGKSEKDVRAVCAGAEIVNGLAIKGSQAAESGAAVTKWAKAALRD